MVLYNAKTKLKEEENLERKKKSPERVFHDLIDVKDKNASERKYPFCRPCAWQEYRQQEKMMQMKLESEGVGFNGYEEEFYKLAKGVNLDKFCGAQWHSIKGATKSIEPRVVDGVKIQSHVGYHVEHQCKKVDTHHSSIQLTLSEYEEFLEKNKKDKDKLPDGTN